MARLPYWCAIISMCLAGALLLLPLCWGVDDDQYNFDYDSTQSPEYLFNSTFDYSFFSNVSSEELEKFLMGGGTDTGGDTNITETETDGSVREEKPTEPTIFVRNQTKIPYLFEMGFGKGAGVQCHFCGRTELLHTELQNTEASRSAPICFLITLILMVHQVLRLL